MDDKFPWHAVRNLSAAVMMYKLCLLVDVSNRLIKVHVSYFTSLAPVASLVI